MTQKTLDASDASTLQRTFADEEIFPGVVERRHFLRSSAVSFAAVVALGVATQGLTKPVLADGGGADKLDWENFLKASVPVAQQMVADPAFSVDEYLYRIGSLATRLKEIPDTKLFPYTEIDPRVFFAPCFRGSPFFIIQWRIEPGAVLPPHNHPNASVCTLGYEGELRLRNFEIIDTAPDYSTKTTFRVRETHNETMTKGRVNTLSPARDNIHSFRAGKEGARGIDISTMHGKMDPFCFLDISDKPVDAEKRIFEAAWSEKGRPKPGKS